MAKAKSSNLALIRGPRRYLEGSYREVPPTFVYHYTFKQVGNTVIVANAALPIQLTPKLTLSQLVAKFPNKTLDDLILENAKSKSGWTRATPEQAEQYRKIKAQHDAYCLKAFAQRAKARLAQPAAQQAVAYAELPEKYYLAGEKCLHGTQSKCTPSQTPLMPCAHPMGKHQPPSKRGSAFTPSAEKV